MQNLLEEARSASPQSRSSLFATLIWVAVDYKGGGKAIHAKKWSPNELDENE